MADGLTTYTEVLEVLDNLRVAVREARRRDGLSLRDLSDRAGIGFNSILRFERGEDVRLFTAVALIKWLAEPPRPPGAAP